MNIGFAESMNYLRELNKNNDLQVYLDLRDNDYFNEEIEYE